MELNQLSNISCVPPDASQSFENQMIFVFSQLRSQAPSFFSSLDEVQVSSQCFSRIEFQRMLMSCKQLSSLTRICKRRVALDGQVVMKEGEMSEP